MIEGEVKVMPMWMVRAVFVAGLCVLFHSAISAAQHRSFQRISRQVREAGSVENAAEELKLPLDIVLETLISMCVVLWCFVNMTFKLKNIFPEAEYENRTMESLDFRPSFMVFGQKESLYKLRLLDQNTQEKVEAVREVLTPVPMENVAVREAEEEDEDDMPPLTDE